MDIMKIFLFVTSLLLGLVFMQSVETKQDLGLGPSLVVTLLNETQVQAPLTSLLSGTVNLTIEEAFKLGFGERNITGQPNKTNLLLTLAIDLDTVLKKHLTKREIRRLAETEDIARINGAIQKLVSDDDIPCQAKSAFMHEVLGQMRQSIAKKKIQMNQIQSRVRTAQAQIKKAENQIAKAQKAKDNLDISRIQGKFNFAFTRLLIKYDDLTSLRHKIRPQLARVGRIEKEIENLKKSNEKQTGIKSEMSQKLVSARQNINKLELEKSQLANINITEQLNSTTSENQKRLKETQSELTRIQANIIASNDVILSNNKKLEESIKNIQQIKLNIRNPQSLLTVFEIDSKNIENQLENIKAELSSTRAKEANLSEIIKTYRNKISLQQPKLFNEDAKKIAQSISVLQSFIPAINQEIDNIYYPCFSSIQVFTTSNNITFAKFGGRQFKEYILSTYGQTLNLNTKINYNFQAINPFSLQWARKYGYPWENASDFSCISGVWSTNFGWGLIAGISQNSIKLKEKDGKTVNLFIGSCSRIQSSQQIIRVGQNIAWRGIPTGADGFNVHSITTWS